MRNVERQTRGCTGALEFGAFRRVSYTRHSGRTDITLLDSAAQCRIELHGVE